MAGAIWRRQRGDSKSSLAARRRAPRARWNSGIPERMVTKGGLVFVGGGDPFLYAFDKATGKELWRVPTPYATSGNPMTYRARSGRQFVVIATGGGPDARLAAFALGSGRPGPTLSTAVESSTESTQSNPVRRRTLGSANRATAPTAAADWLLGSPR